MNNFKNKCQDRKKLTVRHSNQRKTAASQRPITKQKHRLTKNGTIRREARAKAEN